jgi:hypothetical protein
MAGVEFSSATSARGWLACRLATSAKTVLGLSIPTPISEAYSAVLDSTAYQIARAAEAGDLTKARTLFDAAWSGLGKRPSSGEFYTLESLGEILLVAGMTDEARTLVKLLADNSVRRQRRGYHRLDHRRDREGSVADRSGQRVGAQHRAREGGRCRACGRSRERCEAARGARRESDVHVGLRRACRATAQPARAR